MASHLRREKALRRCFRRLHNYAKLKSALRESTNTYQIALARLRVKRMLTAVIRANDRTEKLHLASGLRKTALCRSSLTRWRENVRCLAAARTRRYLMHKSFAGWRHAATQSRTKEDGKARFYRTLLLKKFALHLWKRIKNSLQLARIADGFFKARMFHRWREGRYRTRIQLQLFAKQTQTLAEARKVRRLTRAAVRIIRFAKGCQVRKAYLDKGSRQY